MSSQQKRDIGPNLDKSNGLKNEFNISEESMNQENTHVDIDTLKRKAIKEAKYLRVTLKRLELDPTCPICTRTYKSKDALCLHLNKIHKLKKDRYPASVNMIKWTPRRDLCTACSKAFSRIREHKKVCKKFKSQKEDDQTKHYQQKSDISTDEIKIETVKIEKDDEPGDTEITESDVEGLSQVEDMDETIGDLHIDDIEEGEIVFETNEQGEVIKTTLELTKLLKEKEEEADAERYEKIN